jgi:ABC-type multidrug transport system permease subunit
MTEVSNLMTLTGPLLTFGSIGFGIAVYLYKNDQIGYNSYNAIILFAGSTILTALFAVCGFALDVFYSNFNVNKSTILSGLLFLSGVCGLVAALIAAVGIVLYEVPFKGQE